MNSAGLDASLQGIDRLMVDSSAIIALHERSESAHAIAVHLFERIERGDFLCYYSVVSMAEVLIRPMRVGPHAEQYMHNFLSNFPNLVIMHVDERVAQQAAAVRMTTRLKMPDSFVIATGLLANCGAFLCNDEHWKRCQKLFPQMRWIYLKDYEK